MGGWGPWPGRGRGGGGRGTSRIKYVSLSGNNSRTGRDWDTALKSIDRAAFILRDENPDDNGTIIYESGSWASVVDGAGVWWRGPDDLGIGGDGWFDVGNPPNLVAVPTFTPFLGWAEGQFAPGNGAPAFIDSPFQYCGNVNGVTIENLFCLPSAGPGAFPAMRLGLSSRLDAVARAWDPLHTYTNGDIVVSGGNSFVSLRDLNLNHAIPGPNVITDAWWLPCRPFINDGLAGSLTARLWLKNVTAQINGAGTGTAIDIGYMFWLFANQITATHFSATGDDDINNCAIRGVSAGPASIYQTQFNDAQVAGGGVYAYGNVKLRVRDFFGENMEMPVIRGVPKSGDGSPYVRATAVDSSDSPNNMVLQNEGLALWVADDIRGGDSIAGNIQIIDCYSAEGSIGVGGQPGIIAGVAEIRQDSSRFAVGPVPAVYPNVVRNLLARPGGTTVVGPDGALSGIHGAYSPWLYIPDADLAIDDTVLWSLWVKFDGLPNSQFADIINLAGGTGRIRTQFGETSHAPGAAVSWWPGNAIVAGQWKCIQGWLRVLDNEGGYKPGISNPSQGSGVSYAYGWAALIPAGDGLPIQACLDILRHQAPAPVVFKSYNPADPDSAVQIPPPPGDRAHWPFTGKEVQWDVTLQKWVRYYIDNGTWTFEVIP